MSWQVRKFVLQTIVDVRTKGGTLRHVHQSMLIAVLSRSCQRHVLQSYICTKCSHKRSMCHREHRQGGHQFAVCRSARRNVCEMAMYQAMHVCRHPQGHRWAAAELPSSSLLQYVRAIMREKQPE